MARMVHIEEVERSDRTVLTVGTFDGVHAGHRVLIKKVVEKARKRGARSVIVTFDPHPREIINPGKSGIKLLSTLEERRELLAEIDIDEMVVIPFDRDFSLNSSETFVRDIIWKQIGVSEFVIGYDHQFGRNREGTIETIQSLGAELGFEVYVVSRQEVGENIVSSTAIRNALQIEGDVELAASLLERPYRISGTVIHGDGRGQKIGYPTANIQPGHADKVIPRSGVYAVRVRVEGEFHNGMMNIGIRPTFDGQEETLEVHLFDFNKNIYGSPVQIHFIRRVRDEQGFDGPEALVRQLKKDEEVCRSILADDSEKE